MSDEIVRTCSFTDFEIYYESDPCFSCFNEHWSKIQNAQTMLHALLTISIIYVQLFKKAQNGMMQLPVKLIMEMPYRLFDDYI